MDIKVRTNISSEFKNIKIYINTPKRNEEVQRIENEILVIKCFWGKLYLNKLYLRDSNIINRSEVFWIKREY